MAQVLERSAYVLADGQPMLPMAALLGHKIPERIDGIGLMEKLLAMANHEGFSVFLLGAKQEVLEECVRRIAARFPDLKIAGYRNGYFNERETAHVAECIGAEPAVGLHVYGGDIFKLPRRMWHPQTLEAHALDWGLYENFARIASAAPGAPAA